MWLVTTMAFTTHFLKNSQHPEMWARCARQSARSLIMGWVLVCMAFISSPAFADTPVDLKGMKFERQDSALYMSAELQFELPSVLEEALKKGVTLYFVTDVEITQERWFIYQQRVVQVERHVRLFYQPLTRRWRVNVSSQPFSPSSLGISLGQSYDTVEEAMGAVKKIVQWRVGQAADYRPDLKQVVTLNFKLDLKQLPKPLQIGAAGQRDWDIELSKTQRLEVAP